MKKKKEEERKERNPQSTGKASLKKAENIWQLPCLASAFRSHRVTYMNQISFKDAYKTILSYFQN